jgi:hypothetical protein
MKKSKNLTRKQLINKMASPDFIWEFDSQGLAYQMHKESYYQQYLQKSYKSVSNINL